MLEPGSPVVIGVMPGLRPAVVECASEIAELLEIPLATALSKYHRGLKKLRTALEGDDAP